MQFHVDIDSGDVVAGWVLPDNPSATPSITVKRGADMPVTIPAATFRQDLKDLGVHHTGMVGFQVDGTALPGLCASDTIEIREAESQVLIHRRFRDGIHLPLKLMRFEMSAMPQLPLDGALAEKFALTYHAAERYSFDTMFAIVTNWHARSTYISGRPFLTRYMQQLRDRDFKMVALLRDPIEELAERLLFLKFVASGKSPDFVLDHMTGLMPLLDLAQRADLNDENKLTSAISSLSEGERDVIANPFVRILACSADEMAEPHHVSIALENLANLDLVGVQSRFDDFRTDLARLLGTDPIGEQKPAAISNARVIADRLGKLRAVHKLLALDLRLYQFVTEAFVKSYG